MDVRLGKNKGFIILMIAQLISGLGDWLSIVAIITLVGLNWNASAMEMSFIILCLAVPMALLGPIAGTVADRVSRKMLMMISDWVRAGLILLLAFADSIWTVYVCLFLIGMLSAVFIPAKNGKLKELVHENHMKSAMSITSMIDSGTKVLGPLLSGLLVAAFGTKLVFYIDSATFMISALLIILLPKGVNVINEQKDFKESGTTSFKEEFLEGMSFIKGNRFFMTGMLVLGISLLILQLSDSQIIVLIRGLSDVSPDLFGYIVTAAGLGMFFSGLLLAKKTDYNTLQLMFIGVCGIGLGFGMMAVLTGLDLVLSSIWAPAMGLIAGFAAGLVFIPFQATVQTDTPVHMTGRVFGVINSVTTTATIIGPLLGGMLVTVLGVIPTFLLTGSLLIATSIIGYTFKSKIERGKIDVSESQQGAQGAAPS
ncbi:MFS transporter [Chengkuizengella axinellae]|uniref:MFS transporter n=1 Tax=Chengkuizengella axinellae TaxID=3064388 RepID=A0ABT9J3W6_9BACL|nr:MFS transporter [Chengkuizengella sp. 2205SS18-9]MDP5276311.1 MFS transporter [Chengkuizengella sp. 2205SS18-9]